MSLQQSYAANLKLLSSEIAWDVGRIQAKAGVIATSVAVTLGWDDADVMTTRAIAELTLVDTAGALLTDKGRELYRRIYVLLNPEVTANQRSIGLASVQLLLELPVAWPDDPLACQSLQHSYDTLG